MEKLQPCPAPELAAHVDDTAGSKVRLIDGSVDGRLVKAIELSGRPGLQYWRNSLSGALEARPRAGARIELNAALHANS